LPYSHLLREMYFPQSGERLSVLDELGQVQGDRILLEAVEIQ